MSYYSYLKSRIGTIIKEIFKEALIPCFIVCIPIIVFIILLLALLYVDPPFLQITNPIIKIPFTIVLLLVIIFSEFIWIDWLRYKENVEIR